MEVNDSPTKMGNFGSSPVVNGDSDSPGKTATSPGLGFRHALPQIAGMMRSTKIAQSKASAKRESSEGIKAVVPEATLHVDGTNKVVTMDANLKTEINVHTAVSPTGGSLSV